MKIVKRLLLGFLTIAVVLCSCVTALAGGSAVYSGDAANFIFSPGSDHSPTDMFTEFKDVMPGDSIKQTIVVRNDASIKKKVKIFIRSLGAVENAEFLSQLRLRVEKADDSVMFDANADQSAQLTDWYELGTLYSGGEVTLDVLLEVPTSLDNTNQNLIGKLDWEFAVEEYDIEPTDPKPAATGDDSNIFVWIGLALVSAILIIMFIVMRCRKKEKDPN